MDFEAAVTIGVGVIMLAVMALMAGQVVGVSLTVADGGATQSSLNTTDGSASLPAVARNLSLKQSLGDALALDGSADAGLSSGGGVNISSDAELCTHVAIDARGQNQTVATADGELWIEYAGNRTTETWVGAHYNRSDRTTYDVTTAAASPGDLTHVCVRAAGGTLTLAVNATDQASVTEDGSHTLDAHASPYSSLNGTLEETRVYDRALGGSERATLYQTPTHPLETGAEARLMYDSYDKSPSNLPVYFTGESASVSGQLVDGAEGQNLRGGTDYQLSNNALQVQDGGRLDRAPVVFLTYEGASGPFAAVLNAVATIGGAALSLLVVGLMAIAATAVMQVFDGF